MLIGVRVRARACLGGQVPWEGITNEDIELHVRGGERVPMLEVDPTDTILVLINSLIDVSLAPSPTHRPTIMKMNSQFAQFMRAMLADE
jgi:hypothetical protein